MSISKNLLRDDGNILAMSAVLVALLVATGMGYMHWSSDERWDTAYEEATVQAYFLAQAGLIEQGLTYLRTREPSELPKSTVYLQGKVVEGLGSYYNTKLVYVSGLGESNVFQRSDTYDVFSTGRTEFASQVGKWNYENHDNVVERTAKVRARLRSFANYMYLTDKENTQYNEIIWFWTYDTLYGRTHSNDFIGLKYSPHFYGPISTSQSTFLENNANPYFAFDPQFNVPPVYFPTEAQTLRAAANPWVEGKTAEGREMMTRVYFRGEQGILIYQYPFGDTGPDLYQFNADNVKIVAQMRVPTWGAIFINGRAEIYGEVRGALTVGTASDMYLVDDIRYATANELNGHFDWKTMTHMLGLISEKNIIIRNNKWNGREDGYGNYSPNNTDFHSIIIDAGMVALGESFTFEQQNDEWEPYQGPEPDERGIIHLSGAVTQVRRGYVHRSNHTGTGYGKDYNYDFRFDTRPPPYYLEALDENGHGLFDIISWGELKATGL